MSWPKADIKVLVERTIKSIIPDAAIHCAAWTAVDMAEDDDKVKKVRVVNAGGTQNIADACRKIGCKIFYLSTNYVFNGQGTSVGNWIARITSC